MSKTVKHQSIELEWISPIDIQEPRTLVLGSFNPYESKKKSVDYYYGRSKNHFWRTISNIIGQNDEYFFDKVEGINRKKLIMQNRFCCLDVIDSIDFKSESESVLDDYIKNEIFSNYLDQKIWTGNTNYKKRDSIQIVRKYNQSIIEFLKSTNSIERVIHTMGRNRITKDSANPKEAKHKDNGFSGFIKNIKKICTEKNIFFVLDSLSPSDYAVKNGKTKKEDLKVWLKSNLYLSDYEANP